MGSTTNGIDYPDPSGVPSRSALQDLAESADEAIVALLAGIFGSGTLPNVQWGNALYSGSIASGATADVTVTLAATRPYSAAPNVLATSQFTNAVCSVLSRTTTSITIRIRNDGSSTLSNPRFFWLTIGV